MLNVGRASADEHPFCTSQCSHLCSFYGWDFTLYASKSRLNSKGFTGAFFFFLIYSCFLEQKSRFHCPVYFLTHFTLLCTCLCSHLSCVRLFLLCPRPLPFPPCCESLSCSKSLAPSGRPPSTRSLFPDCCLVHRTEPSLSLHLALQWDSLPAQLELL